MSDTGSERTAQIEAEIEAQREQLAETVDQLTHKLDVKAQTQERVALLKDRATTEDGKPRPVLLVSAASAVAALGALIWWRKR